MGLQLLRTWIQEQFPDKEIVYRGKTFLFHSDIPIDSMKEIAEEKYEGVDRVKQMLRILSINPKITTADTDIMGGGMLMDLYGLLTAKKAKAISPNSNINNISSVESSINPAVKSENGEPLRPNA